MLHVILFFTACTQGDEAPATTLHEDTAVNFSPYIGKVPESRAGAPGEITQTKLQTLGFGVFAQHTGDSDWSGYTKTVPFNFMWNQKVEWDDDATAWTYEPLKYWPNDNNPADDQGATGSLTHSYLSFFAYAPYTDVAAPGSGFDVKDTDSNSDGKPDHDGIVKIVANTTNVNSSYLYYRTSNEKPFGVDESVDLLWATKQDCYKYDTDNANDYGRIDDRVPLVFKHALTKLDINVRAMVDRTADYSSPAYPTDLDPNTRIFIKSVEITTPDYYSEGKLKLAPVGDTPSWDYTELDAKKNTGFVFGKDADGKFKDDVKYSMRYEAPNVPVNASITDSNADELDDATGLTLLETARAGFDAMEAGVLSTEQQLSANYPVFMFPPSTNQRDVSITAVYHVVTFDPNLTLNDPKYYSDVTNNITASLGSNLKFDPNKQYKILLSLGVTSAKFEVSVLDENGEWILLSAVVKDWDEKTAEVDVK